ncbi:unnamed protein product [Leptidea sinapis]|uniref:Uncharacterized protein n=1 Tax=Leptidea sinapis TaxID=189913 RepID=A0A5E4Q8Z8_9NEOP|nr:unnamed protein product [Leptidea sinapis]
MTVRLLTKGCNFSRLLQQIKASDLAYKSEDPRDGGVDDIKAIAGKEWMKTGQDKKIWKRLMPERGPISINCTNLIDFEVFRGKRSTFTDSLVDDHVIECKFRHPFPFITDIFFPRISFCCLLIPPLQTNGALKNGTLRVPDLPSELKPAITIADATYLYTPKSSNYLLQTMADLNLFACGTYQIKQARSYVGEHFRFHGLRSVGCCSHVMSIIWYLDYARHEEVTRPANFLDDVILRV